GQNSLYDSSAASVVLSDLRSSLAGAPRRAVRRPPRTLSIEPCLWWLVMKCYPSAMAFWGLSSGWVMVRSRVVALFLLVVLCLAETEGFKPYLFSGTRWSYLAGSDVRSSFSWVWPDCLSRKASKVSWLSLPVAAPHPRLLEELKICHKSCVRWTVDLGLAPLLRISVSTLVSSLSIAKRFSSLAARVEDVSFLWLLLMKCW
ncbi:hypothetical protein HID58_084966, partial [Brassica napus]